MRFTPTPALERVVDAIRKAGGRSFLVGGTVRDLTLGFSPKDLDIEVFGLPEADLAQIITKLTSTQAVSVGKSFGVIKSRLGGEEIDFSLPRRERKAGVGHKGFVIEPDHTMSTREAALRRDFKVNSMMLSLDDGTFLDHFGGLDDIAKGVLSVTDAIRFAEDVLRPLRAFQFIARFGFDPSPALIEQSAALLVEREHLSVERVYGEWVKWAERGRFFGKSLAFLVRSGWSPKAVADLVGVQQDPIWHPEGDVFTHTCFCLDSLIDQSFDSPEHRRRIVFAVLGHDFGKPATTVIGERGRWIAPGHADAGVDVFAGFAAEIGLSHDDIKFVQPLIREHMSEADTPRTVRRLSVRLGHVSIDDLLKVVLADNSGRPPKVAALPERIAKAGEIARSLGVEKQAEKRLVTGDDLIALAMPPGRSMGELLKRLFEMQLNGDFGTKAEGIEIAREILTS